MTANESCPECGAPVSGGLEGCFALHAEVSGREFGDPAYAAVNLLTADAHALQHPEQHGVKNNAFHLIRLCWLVEHGGDPRIGQGPRWLQTHFDGNVALPPLAPPPPGRRGTVTVLAAHRAGTPGAHTEAAWTWGRAVWEAWSTHHAWARQTFDRLKHAASHAASAAVDKARFSVASARRRRTDVL